MLFAFNQLWSDHLTVLVNFYYAILAVTGRLSDIGAGIASIAFVGSGVGQGLIASSAISALSRNPELENKIRNFFILGAAIAESGAIYGLVVAIILLFVV